MFSQAACLPQPRVDYSGGGNALLLSQGFFFFFFCLVFFGEGTLLCYSKCSYSGEEKPYFQDLGRNGRWTPPESTRMGWMVFGGIGWGK